VTSGGVALAWITEADDQDPIALMLTLAAFGPAAKERQVLLPAGVARIAVALGLGSGRLALLADQLGLLLD